ncbi:ABC transporter ATP-binding protein [Enterococcus gallinarum]|uniref:ATP-binding cassette domain-containing protein n=1 Tax=Enterococcus gallinarum TaxID=1353 RepID=UPI003D6B2358
MKKVLLVHWKNQGVVLLLMAGVALSQTIASLQNVQVLNSLIQFDQKGFIQGVVGMVLAYSCFLMFIYLQIRYTAYTSQKMSLYLRDQLLTRQRYSDYQPFHKVTVGNYASKLSNDITMIETDGFANIYQVMQGVLSSLFAVIALAQFHWSLIVLTLGQSCLLLLLPKIFQKKMKQSAVATAQANEAFLSKTNELLAGFDTFLNFQRLDFLKNKLLGSAQRIQSAKLKQAQVMAAVSVTGGIGNVTGQLSVLGFTGYLAFLQIVPIGAITATGNLASTIFNTLGNISSYLSKIQGTFPLFDAFAYEKPAHEISLPSKKTNDAKDLVLAQASYCYQTTDGKPQRMLFNLSTTFKAGQKYAIVGESGSGKSTLFSLLTGRRKDYSGSIRLGETEIKEFPLEELQDNVTVIDQRPFVYQASIRENLTLGQFFPDEEIEQALKKAELFAVIEQLPEQLDTVLTETGGNLSGGQLQRLALARGFLWKKPILLVDEGTSNLYQENAKKIEKLLLQQPQTVLFITHHLRDEIVQKLDGVLSLTPS